MILDSVRTGDDDHAYSVARQLASWQRSAGRIRRSSDDDEFAIPFAGGMPDRRKIYDFMGTDDLFLSHFEDATGNGHHATQSDPTKQPRLATAGTLFEIDGRLALDFAGGKWLRTATPTLVSGAYTICCVFKFAGVADTTQALWDGATQPAYMALTGTGSLKVFGSGGDQPIATMNTNRRLLTYRNGEYLLDDTAASGGSVTHTMDGVTIGNLRAGSEGVNWEYDGALQEWARWGASLSLGAISTSADDFYVRRIVDQPKQNRVFANIWASGAPLAS